jgi:hypothetical protein
VKQECLCKCRYSCVGVAQPAGSLCKKRTGWIPPEDIDRKKDRERNMSVDDRIREAYHGLMDLDKKPGDLFTPNELREALGLEILQHGAGDVPFFSGAQLEELLDTMRFMISESYDTDDLPLPELEPDP